MKSSNLADVVPEFDAKYIDIENLEEVFEIILAANYLDIRPLLDLSCAKIASLIKGIRFLRSLSLNSLLFVGKTPEEIRKTFNILNDFTPEEEAQIREENKWAEQAD